MSALKAMELRRSYYNINRELPISEEELIHLVEQVTLLSPDSYNAQTPRVVLVMGKEQDQLWDLIEDSFGGKVPPEKIEGFRKGYGTLLFYIDRKSLGELKEKFPKTADSFEIWAQHATGIVQYAHWLALREKGIGASLQHYHPVIDEAIRKRYDIPEEWELTAQMPFGGIVEEPEKKEKIDIHERVWIRR